MFHCSGDGQIKSWRAAFWQTDLPFFVLQVSQRPASCALTPRLPTPHLLVSSSSSRPLILFPLLFSPQLEANTGPVALQMGPCCGDNEGYVSGSIIRNAQRLTVREQLSLILHCLCLHVCSAASVAKTPPFLAI